MRLESEDNVASDACARTEAGEAGVPKASVRSIKSLLASGRDKTMDTYRVQMAWYMAATAAVLVQHSYAASRATSSAARPAKTFDCSLRPRVTCSDVVFSRRSAGRGIARTRCWIARPDRVC